MSQEFLNEPPKSPPLAEPDQSPVVQKDFEGELSPANVPSERKALIRNQEAVLQSPDALDIRSGELADLDAAIMTTPPDSPDLPERQYTLALGLRDRYARTRELADLEVALEAFQKLAQMLPSGSPAWPDVLNNLGQGLQERYKQSGKLTDLDAAIDAFQQAALTIPPDSPDRSNVLHNLGGGLYERYDRSEKLADLDAARDAFQQAVRATPPDSPDRPGRQSLLGLVLHYRYIRTREQADLEAAIDAFQRALQATSPNSPAWADALHNLGGGLHERYLRDGKLTDLEAAIDAFQQAIKDTPSNSPAWPGVLHDLGRGLYNRYLRNRKLVDLEAAIDAFQQVTQIVPPDSSSWAAAQHHLGSGLHDRYGRSRKLIDLDAAIDAFQQAARIMPPDSPERPTLLNNLGNGLRDRYTWSGKRADLEAAHDAFQQAAEATPSDSPDRPIYWNDLGILLSVLYFGSGDLTALEAAIKVFQQVVRAIPADSPRRPMYLNNLGNGLRERYDHSQKLADLKGAIDAYQQAVRDTPPDSPDLTTLLNNLGSGLHRRYDRSRKLVDLKDAINVWEKSWFLSHSRFAALTVNYQQGQQRQEAGLAVLLVSAYLEQTRQSFLQSSTSLRRALEIAEDSKSRLLTQLVGRGPLPLPAGLISEIAAQEQQLLAELTTLDTQELASYGHLAPAQGEASYHLRLEQRQMALRDLEDLWTKIASVGPEGSAYVALRRGAGLTWQEFVSLAETLGPATLLLSFFTTADRALFLLLRAGWPVPRIVEVPMNQVGWADLRERLFREIHRYSPELRRGETWEQPLLPLLTRAQQHLEGVERLILAPVGDGHLLPWSVLAEHVGWRSSTKQPLPLVTQPALGILPRLRQRPHVDAGPVLVVGNPHSNLPYAEIEANEVAERFGTTPLLGAAATKSAVLSRLPDATLIHLATHAFFHPDNPLESGIELADGVLTAREVLQYRLQADLLVLSACESGQVGSLGGEELAGLSQAFLQIGVRSLLVSLWQVNDLSTAALMQAFYATWQAGADKALALRQAMTQIQQDSRWTHPYYWGSFVLMGDWN